MPNYSATRQEYNDALPSWRLVKRCVAGAREIRKYDEYLPMPDPTNQSEENLERYRQLKKRAMFLNVTGRTRTGLLGAVFRKTAEVQLPSGVQYLLENASGDGASLEQLSKEAVGECLDTGRGGFLADYPKLEGESGRPRTAAESAGKQAWIHHYPALSIINWREKVIEGRKHLVLVVLHEQISEESDDGFEFEIVDQYRVLVLEDGVYKQRLYRDDIPDGEESIPTDQTGKRFDHIPFHFYGSENNDAAVDKGPLEDIADVNILHYGNSATVEEAGFISSQPTLFMTSSITAEDFAKFNPNGVHIGSRRGINLGAQGSATMLQAKETQLALELMRDKQDQMLMIGARIVQKGGGAETAEAVRIRYSSDNSVLGTIAGNVSEALKLAILDAERFMIGLPDMTGTVFWLNQEFFDEAMDAQMILAQVQLWQQGIIAKRDLRTNLRQAGTIESDRTDDDIDDDIEAQPPVTGNDAGNDPPGDGDEQ